MIEEEQYFNTVKDYFEFLVSEFGFKLSTDKIIGNAFYDVQYNDNERIISISYENIEDVFLVIVFLLQKGNLPDYDDKTKTLHLNKLNSLVLSSVSASEIKLNDEYFIKFHPMNEIEKKILKSSKELRLCLSHFNSIQPKLGQ